MIPNRSSWVQVRAMTTEQLHGTAGRFLREQMDRDLTAGQEAMFDQIIAELEWRSARTRRGFPRCTCSLCFVDPETYRDELDPLDLV